jgi:NAD(P)-dependent dehydrogenase (short-subunit alcohol dehydrogenase family)
MSVYKYKTAIVTGGASGIGAQTARIMCLQGMNVVIADLESSRGEAEELISSLSDSRRAIFQPVDVCSWPDLRSVFDSTIEKFGSLEIVVANAGIMETREFFDFDDIDPEGHLKEPSEAHRVIDVNLKGVMNSKVP